MSENTHAKSASELLTSNSNGPTYIDPNTLGLMIAQTEATLALAYEQRTANLIALEVLLQKSGAEINVDTIQERLYEL